MAYFVTRVAPGMTLDGQRHPFTSEFSIRVRPGERRIDNSIPYLFSISFPISWAATFNPPLQGLNLSDIQACYGWIGWMGSMAGLGRFDSLAYISNGLYFFPCLQLFIAHMTLALTCLTCNRKRETAVRVVKKPVRVHNRRKQVDQPQSLSAIARHKPQ